MSKTKKTLLHSLLIACFAVMPVSGFGMTPNWSGNGGQMPPKTEQNKTDNALPHVEKASVRFQVGIGRPYYGRGYYYRPYYYYYPYRSYGYRYNYYPYRPYYGW